jgi:hypothetical protein
MRLRDRSAAAAVRHRRLPSTAHTARPWRIHELARGFRVEDVWALRTPGGPGDFPGLVDGIVRGDPARGSRAAGALWAIRGLLGRLLGWDGPAAGLGSRVVSVRERLPMDLRQAAGPDFVALPFTRST